MKVGFKKKFTFCKAKAMSDEDPGDVGRREVELGLIEKEMEKI